MLTTVSTFSVFPSRKMLRQKKCLSAKEKSI